jgi:hypothetical protein
MVVINENDLASDIVSLVFSTDFERDTVHVHRNVARRGSTFMDSWMSGRWSISTPILQALTACIRRPTASNREAPLQLPDNVTLRGAKDVMLCMYNGEPPFAPHTDEVRRQKFVSAALYFDLAIAVDPAFLRYDAPQRHPALELHLPDDEADLGWLIISSRKPSGTCFKYAAEDLYVAARLTMIRMKSFRIVVALEGHWDEKDKLLLGALPLSDSINQEFMLKPHPISDGSPTSGRVPTSGIWFSISSGRLLAQDGRNLVPHGLSGFPRGGRPKNHGDRWGFEITSHGKFQVGMPDPSHDGGLHWLPVNIDCAWLAAAWPCYTADYSPALLLQPHTRQHDGRIAGVRVVEVSSRSSQED